ncbi:MAG TPA: alpha/beta hydrolase [Eudoraea sp.]|nr:alpha/beta hydrolase [Eudoraea sp.]
MKLVIAYKGISFSIDYIYRHTHEKETILYLHGLGSSKEDFQPALSNERFSNYNILTFDFPGCGKSSYSSEVSLDIDDLVLMVKKLSDNFGLETIHIIGHSMGGLTGLLFANRYPEKVQSFVNIEGNLDMADCRVFSRFVNDYTVDSNEKIFFSDFKSQLNKNDSTEYDIFVSNLSEKIKYNPLRDYSQSIVKYCIRSPLLEYFLNLPVDKYFIYGEYNRNLPYIPVLVNNEIPCLEIPNSNHFPFYANPTFFFNELGKIYGLC